MGSARDAIGVDIGQSSVKLVAAHRAGDGLVVTHAQILIVSDEAGLEVEGAGGGNALAEAVRRLGARPGAVVASVERSTATVRTLVLPVAGGEDLARIVHYEAESHLPFPVAGAELAHVPLASANGQTRVLITACPRSSVTQRRDLLANAGLPPTEISVSTLATLNGLALADAEFARQDCLVVDLGADVTEVAVSCQGEPVSSFTLALGGRSLTLALSEDLGVDLAEAELRKRRDGIALDAITGLPAGPGQEHLGAWVQRLYSGLHRAVGSHDQADPSRPVGSVVLLGGGSLVPGLAAGLAGALRLPVRYADPCGTLGFTPSEGAPSSCFVTALGLAMQGVGLGELHVDLTPSEVLATQRARVQRGVWVVAGAALGALLLAVTAWQALGAARAHGDFRGAMAELELRQGEANVLDLTEVEMAALEGIVGRAQDRKNDPLDILAFLSESLPAEVRLKDLSFARDDSLTLKGEAMSNAAATRAQQVLEASGRFRDVILNHSTATDVAGRTLYTFDILCKLRGVEEQ